ncbi:LysR family transcriptional regulator [Caulobacter hibisci]|uniref:LysR family transcriptional regulator n=1 Tax=Caulobacter hibisci TaxID=2035993 RepID=A0ABS0SWY1_9CAUL|nr:LysR family transcriptional regulator [Caulobacter hibisci]MBI1684093.1 LysR family transcriptional regulator [Caulobacter hibisci]
MRFQGLDLNLLVALDALLTEQNVSAAAENVHLSQSAMSSALNRLRDYFGDDLLSIQGRRMVLTPRAESLADPVRTALLHIRSTITTQPTFDPATAKRAFTLSASDYAQTVVVAPALARVREIAPGLSFDITAPGPAAQRALEQGELDIYLSLEQFAVADHPHAALFEDDYVVVAWKDNPLTQGGVDAALYFDLGHVSVQFGPARLPAFDEWFIKSARQPRKVEVTVPSFVMAPQFLIGTSRITTMHRRLAETFAATLPIAVFPVPFEIPKVRQVAQWHRFNERDEGIRWLVAQMRETAGEAPHKSNLSNLFTV